MAVKPSRLFFLILLIVLAGIAVTLVIRSRHIISGRNNADKFISTYLALSIAREQLGGQPDSLKSTFQHIFKRYGTDSLWMDSYARGLSKNLGDSQRVWEEITGRLDSLKRIPNPDTISIY
jgi:hypothetical protein